MWKRKRSREAPANDPTLVAESLQRLEAENRRLLTEFDAMQHHFGGLARSIWRVQEDERRRLAHELHDDVGQNLTALRQRLERLPPSPDREDALALASQVLDDVRELSRLLRPPILDQLGLAAALQWLSRRIGESAEIRVSVEVGDLEEVALSDDAQILLFRVAQEALTNATRHGRAPTASVRASRTGDRIELEIRDDGQGFDPGQLESDPERLGIGLTGMRDRVRLFGGDLAIRSRPGRGTTVHVGINVPASGDTA